MNHTIQNVSSAIARCKKFTQCQVSRLRGLAFIAQINSFSSRALTRGLTAVVFGFGSAGSYAISSVIKAGHFYRLPILRLTTTYQQPVNNLVQKLTLRSRHAEVIHMLDWVGTLLARALRGSGRALKRTARPVAIVIGISLCLPMSHATSGSIEAIHPKDYVRLALDDREAKCLSRLIGKESAWNPKAVGNLSSPSRSFTYGLLQLKNPVVKDKSPIEQIHYGLKYIDHRYQGDTCKAWKHWKDRGWH